MRRTVKTSRGRRLPKALDKSLWERIIEQALTYSDGRARQQEIIAIRDRAIAALLFGSGLRSAELTALDVRDVDLEKRTVHVRHGKGDKERLCGLSRRAARMVESYLDMRETVDADSPLFLSRKGGARLTTRGIRDLVDRLETALGMKKDGPHKRGENDGLLNPHIFRHSHATEMVRSAKKRGQSIFEVAEQLGHSNLETTRGYFRLVTDDLVDLAEDL